MTVSLPERPCAARASVIRMIRQSTVTAAIGMPLAAVTMMKGSVSVPAKKVHYQCDRQQLHAEQHRAHPKPGCPVRICRTPRSYIPLIASVSEPVSYKCERTCDSAKSLHAIRSGVARPVRGPIGSCCNVLSHRCRSRPLADVQLHALSEVRNFPRDRVLFDSSDLSLILGHM